MSVRTDSALALSIHVLRSQNMTKLKCVIKEKNTWIH